MEYLHSDRHQTRDSCRRIWAPRTWGASFPCHRSLRSECEAWLWEIGLWHWGTQIAHPTRPKYREVFSIQQSIQQFIRKEKSILRFRWARWWPESPFRNQWKSSRFSPSCIPLARGWTCGGWRIVATSHWWSWCKAIMRLEWVVNCLMHSIPAQRSFAWRFRNQQYPIHQWRKNVSLETRPCWSSSQSKGKDGGKSTVVKKG